MGFRKITLIVPYHCTIVIYTLPKPFFQREEYVTNITINMFNTQTTCAPESETCTQPEFSSDTSAIVISTELCPNQTLKKIQYRTITQIRRIIIFPIFNLISLEHTPNSPIPPNPLHNYILLQTFSLVP